jgi:hypothetical protein
VGLSTSKQVVDLRMQWRAGVGGVLPRFAVVTLPDAVATILRATLAFSAAMPLAALAARS